jgi:hypothetical protein
MVLKYRCSRVLKNSHEIFQNFHSRVLEGISNAESSLREEKNPSVMSYLNQIFSSFGSKSHKSRDIPTAKANKTQASIISRYNPARSIISLGG